MVILASMVVSGANVNYVTKSGANEFHGNALYWWNGRIINANDWFNKFVQPGTPITPQSIRECQPVRGICRGTNSEKSVFLLHRLRRSSVSFADQLRDLTLIPSSQFETATIANLTVTGHNASIPLYNQMFNLWNNAPGAERAVAGNPQTGDLTGCNGWIGPSGLVQHSPAL